MRAALPIALGLVLLNVAVFVQVRDFDFISYDDPGHVTEVYELRQGVSVEGIRWAFGSILISNYIPVTTLTYLFDHGRAELDAGAFHVTNLAFHIANTLLLFAFFACTTKRLWPSALVAALFAIHPLHVESVAWVSSRKDVVFTFFWLLTMLAYAAYSKRPRISSYFLVFALLCFALLSKPMAVTLPFAFVLLDVWPLKRIPNDGLFRPENRTTLKRILVEKVPFLIPIGAVGALTFAAQQRAGAVSSTELLSIGQRLANIPVNYVAYVGRTIFPADLLPFYPYPEAGVPLAMVVGATAFVVTASVVALAMVDRRPWLMTGWFWFVGTLVPVIGLVQVGGQATADRYTYVPLIGLFVIVAWGLVEGVTRRPRGRLAVAAVSLLVVVTLAWLAHAQTARWRDSRTLFAYVVETHPGNVVGQSSLGRALLEAGEIEDAKRHVERALEIHPGHLTARLNRGIIYAKEGDYEAAIASYNAVLRADADNSLARTNIGSALVRQGKPKEALGHLRVALERNPNNADALVNLGAAYILLDRDAEAIEPLLRALELTPGDSVAHLNLAVAYVETGDHVKALASCRDSLRVDPNYTKAIEFLALLESRAP